MTRETGVLGQCVYTMSTGKRCQRDAEVALRYGSIFAKDLPAYGYCSEHQMMVLKPRDPRIHKTAEPLIAVKQEPVVPPETYQCEINVLCRTCGDDVKLDAFDREAPWTCSCGKSWIVTIAIKADPAAGTPARDAEGGE